jgi:hypothetical protein
MDLQTVREYQLMVSGFKPAFQTSGKRLFLLEPPKKSRNLQQEGESRRHVAGKRDAFVEALWPNKIRKSDCGTHRKLNANDRFASSPPATPWRRISLSLY